MEKGEDPYAILAVPYDIDCEGDELRRIYRKLALKHHPDRQNSEEDKEKAHDEFAKISAAYDLLTDPVKRYDWKQANEKKLNDSSHNGEPKTKPKAQPKAPTKTQSKFQPKAPPMASPRKTNSTGGFRKGGTAPARPRPRPRSASPDRNTAGAPQSSSASTSGHSHAPPPPSGVFSAFQRQSRQSNPHSQHPGLKKKTSTSAPQSSSSYSNTPGTRESAGGKRPNMSSPNLKFSGRKSSTTNGSSASTTRSDTSYSATPGTRENVSPRPNSKPKINLSGLKSPRPSATMRKKKSVQPPSSAPAVGVHRKASISAPQSASGGRRGRVKNMPGLSAMPDLDGSVHSTRSHMYSSRSQKSFPPQTTSSAAANRSKSQSKGSGRRTRSTSRPHGSDGASSGRRRAKSGSPRPGLHRKMSAPPKESSKFMSPRSGRKKKVNSDDSSSVDELKRQESFREKFVQHQAQREHVQAAAAATEKHIAAAENLKKKKASSTTNAKTVAHDPFAVFERKMREHFPVEYKEGEWKKKGWTSGKRIIQAKSVFGSLKEKDPLATVVSMTTSSKKEKRPDKNYDYKTVTKLVKADGSVEKVCQASVLDKETAKKVETDTLTITREKALLKHSKR